MLMIKRLITFFLIFSSGFSYEAFAQQESKERARLEKGAILVHSEKDPGTGDQMAVGRVIFQAPLDTSWQVITDYLSYPKFLSDLRELKVEKKEGNQTWVRVKLKNVWPFPDYNLLLSFEESKESGAIKFQMKQGDFAKYYGSWKLIGLDQSRTLAEYRLFQYIGWWWFPMIPKTLTNNSIVSGQLNDFRKYIRDIQIENSLEPDKVIKPFWRKSIFKDRKETESKTNNKDSTPAPEDQKK